MSINKHYALLLLTIPIYGCYLYVDFLFKSAHFLISNLFFFSIFIISTTIILLIRQTIVKAILFSAAHLLLLLPILYAWGGEQITVTNLWAYGLYCIPSIYLLEINIRYLEKQTPHKYTQKQVSFNTSRFIFDLYLTLLIVLLFIIMPNHEFSFSFFNEGCVLFFLLFIFLFYCRYCFSNKTIGSKGKEKKKYIIFFTMMSVLALTDCLIYAFYMNQHTENLLQLIFPLFLVTFIFFDQHKAAKEAVFHITNL